MKKKSKTPKTTKPTKSEKSSNDQLEINYGGLTIKSDYVYGKDSQIFKLATGSLTREQIDNITGFGVEYELSPNQIVSTQRTVVSQPFISASGSVWRTHTRRVVANGSFAVEGKSLVNYPKSQSEVTWSVEGSELEEFPNAPANGELKKQYFDVKVINGMSDNVGSAHWYELRNTGDIYGNPDDLAWFRSYEGGKFFADGWWNNPFDSNLI
jgi:hypothetical protein